jgi:chromosome segregation ATPase
MVKGVSFEAVAAVCNNFQSENRKISIRTVHAELEGSPSFKTVSELIDRWREQQREISAHHSAISENLRNSIMAEIGRNITATRSELDEKVKESNDKVVELLALLAEAETHTENLNKKLQSSAEETASIRTALEKELVAAEERIKAAEKRAEECLHERDVAMRTLEISRTEAAKAQFQLERADTACTEANSRTHDLERKNAELREAQAEAEQRAAVAETRADERRSQIDALQKNLSILQDQLSETLTALDSCKQEKADAEKNLAVLETKHLEIQNRHKKP